MFLYYYLWDRKVSRTVWCDEVMFNWHWGSPDKRHFLHCLWHRKKGVSTSTFINFVVTSHKIYLREKWKQAHSNIYSFIYDLFYKHSSPTAYVFHFDNNGPNLAFLSTWYCKQVVAVVNCLERYKALLSFFALMPLEAEGTHSEESITIHIAHSILHSTTHVSIHFHYWL